MRLEDLTWPEAREQAENGITVVVPVGSTEEHGPHLPVDTDIYITKRIAEAACERTGAIMAPPVNYGYNEKEFIRQSSSKSATCWPRPLMSGVRP